MRKFLAYILIITALHAFSQVKLNYIDSLRQNLNLYAKTDSIKFKFYKRICTYFTNNSEYDSVIYYGKKALTEAQRIKNYRNIILFNSKIGIGYWHQAKYDSAIFFYDKGLSFCKFSRDTTNYAMLYNNMGLAYWDKLDLPNALINFNNALEIDRSANDKVGEAICLLNIGLVYIDMGDYASSLEFYFKSAKMFEELKDEQSLAMAYINIGLVYYKQDNYLLAKTYYKKAEIIAIKINDQRNLALVSNNLGSVYSELKQLDSALYYYTNGLKFNRELGEYSGQTLSYNNLADVHIKLNDLKKALSYYTEALKIEKEHELFDDELNTREGLSVLYYKLKMYKEAYDNHLIYSQLVRKTDSIKNIAEISKIHSKIEVEQREKELNLEKQKELAVKEAEKQKQVFIIFSVSIVLLITIIFSGVLLKRYRLTQVQKKIIEEQKHIVEEHRQEILDSIQYAKKIQYALLAQDQFLIDNINEHFILFKPKDVVSGDFYWATKKENRIYLAVCDSTGHGVPGAFMSLLNINYLNEAINEKNISKPNEILNYVRVKLIEHLSKDGRQDGMDGILICIDKDSGSYSYAAANNSPILISNNNLTELAADKMPVGQGVKTESFTNHQLQLQKGDVIYLYTDGYADQFGGPKGKKFKYKQLNNLLLENSLKSLDEQKAIVNQTFENWMGKLEQVDDVCIIAIKI